MAKSTKHADAVGSFDNFKAPWESEAGADAEIDKSKLKRLIYNVRVDVAKAKDALEDSRAEVETITAERDEAKTQAADGSGVEAQKKIDKLTEDLKKVTDERDGLVAAKDLADLRAEVLGDFAAENPKAAKYVVGATKEELEKSLEEVKADFGITDADGEDEDEDEDEDRNVSTRPRSKSLTTGLDKDAGKGGEQEIDFDKVADDYLGGSIRY